MELAKLCSVESTQDGHHEPPVPYVCQLLNSRHVLCHAKDNLALKFHAALEAGDWFDLKSISKLVRHEKTLKLLFFWL